MDDLKESGPQPVTTLYQTIIHVIGSIIAGLYLGFSSKNSKQSWIQCFILLGISTYCIMMTLYTKKYSHKKVYASFIVPFFISALTVPISFWFSEQIF